MRVWGKIGGNTSQHMLLAIFKVDEGHLAVCGCGMLKPAAAHAMLTALHHAGCITCNRLSSEAAMCCACAAGEPLRAPDVGADACWGLVPGLWWGLAVGMAGERLTMGPMPLDCECCCCCGGCMGRGGCGGGCCCHAGCAGDTGGNPGSMCWGMACMGACMGGGACCRMMVGCCCCCGIACRTGTSCPWGPMTKIVCCDGGGAGCMPIKCMPPISCCPCARMMGPGCCAGGGGAGAMC